MPVNPPDVSRLEAAAHAVLQRQPDDDGDDVRRHERRIAAHILELVAREHELGQSLRADEQLRLFRLLGTDTELDRANALLCERIRSGVLATDTPALIDHLRANALAKLAIDNPRYPARERAINRQCRGGD